MALKLIVFIITYFEFCGALQEAKGNGKCDETQCYSSITLEDCYNYRGKYIAKSLDENNCYFCSTCIVRRSFGESCFPSHVNGLQIRCDQSLYCEKRYEHLGYICLETKILLEFERKLKLNKRKKFKQIKHKYMKPYFNQTKKHILGTKESETPLKRKIRSPLKIGLLGNNEKKKKQTKTVLSDIDIEKFLKAKTKIDNKKYTSKQVKMVKAGNSNTVNQNSGSTFIINNNYYAYIGGKLTKLKEPPKGSRIIGVKMDPISERKPVTQVSKAKNWTENPVKKLKSQTVTTITDQRYGKEGKKTNKTYMFTGSAWRMTEEDGKPCDLEPDAVDLKLLNDRINNPVKDDKAIFHIEQVQEVDKIEE